MAWGRRKSDNQPYPKSGGGKQGSVAHRDRNSMSGTRRRKFQDSALFDLSKENHVRLEAAKDLGLIAAERNLAARKVKDAYDMADALERLRTGERKPLIDKIRDR